MPDYTESQIRELTGRELRVAVSLLVLGDDLTANTEDRVDECLGTNSIEYSSVGGFAIRFWKPDGFTFISHCDEETFKKFVDRESHEIWNARHGQPWQSDLEQHVANWRAEPLPMPLEWCVPELMGPGKVLEGCRLCCWSGCWQLYNGNVDRMVTADDPATAILRAACLVKLRKGE